MTSLKKQLSILCALTLLWSFVVINIFTTDKKQMIETVQAAEVSAPSGGVARTFVVTAYYSPLPNQQRYLTGDYALEKRLNGNGTNAADGTPVYAGMLAAPQSYAFGTQIYLPGLGLGTVHDRGGAIVPAGQRGYWHDRVDVWMGHGDEGLTRALQWGKRTVHGRIYAFGGHKPTMEFDGEPTAPSYIAARIPQRSESLKHGSRGENVRKLQANLVELGYVHAPPTGFYGDLTKAGILAFQLAHNVINTKSQAGAGVYGPRTQAAMTKALKELAAQREAMTAHLTKFLPAGLGRGDRGDQVMNLQKQLAKLGYLDAKPNGHFGPRTERAVRDFQLNQDVIAKSDERGAGYFGPKTQAAMLDILYHRQQVLAQKDQSQRVLSGDINPSAGRVAFGQ